jgi:hypothetical protein
LGQRHRGQHKEDENAAHGGRIHSPEVIVPLIKKLGIEAE